jgi:hypothetical protein
LGTLVGSYVALKESGTYTPSLGAEVAGTIAENLRADISYRMYTANDIKNDADASLARMLSYRSDLREALAPLLKNTVYELEVFAYYLETKDGRYLDELNDIAQNYRTATESAVKVVVPTSAVAYHIGILNALSEFEAVLQKLATNADDPFASAALMRTLGDAETHMLLSFEALAGYFRKHSQS